jgi:hypothetical protein
MISYVKIYGPPLMKALKALEKAAVDMPEVCIMDSPIQAGLNVSGVTDYSGTASVGFDSPQGIMEYFDSEDMPKKRCDTIISKSGEKLGEYDFFFEWFEKPNMGQVEGLIKKIDEALEPLGVKYTLTTK